MAIPTGSIIGSALGVGAGIFGGISASKAVKKAKRNIENLQRENEDWYTRRYNEDATQRADAQRVLAQTQQSIRERNRQAAATAAVMGGTDESVAAAKAANNAALAEAASQIAAAGERRKDAVEEQYRATRQNLTGQLNQMELNKANAVKDAVLGAAEGAASLYGIDKTDDE